MQYNYSADKLNRVTVQENNFTATYSRSDVNQYGAINGSANSFDGRFNLTGTGYNGATYTFNAANQLVSATKSGNTGSFLYDGLGRCVQRTINGVTRLFVYDGWKPVVEYDGAGNFFGRRVYGPGPDEILMRGDGYGWYFYHTDKQGSVMSLLDINGNVVERYSYDAFLASRRSPAGGMTPIVAAAGMATASCSPDASGSPSEASTTTATASTSRS